MQQMPTGTTKQLLSQGEALCCAILAASKTCKPREGMRSHLLEAKEDDMRPGKDRLDLLPSGLQRCAARPLFRDEDCNIA
uniref:Uncharacterized protein n=1 Tax=Thermosporothrix sp. COM3 TaxID=2490863 RepID=A0A455SGG8_9CHLR|nr:hypothetical protein KTC_11990 [Thermosporothrix sp. COM3]